MPDAKISALPAATTPLGGTELVPVVQSGVTDQVTVSNLTAGRDVTSKSLLLSGVPITITGPFGSTIKAQFGVASTPATVTSGYSQYFGGYSSTVVNLTGVATEADAFGIYGSAQIACLDNGTDYMGAIGTYGVALRNSASDSATAAGNVNLTGMYAAATHGSTLAPGVTTAVVWGLYAVVTNLKGTMTGAAGLVSDYYAEAGATITTYRGLHLEGGSGAGTVTNKWGVYQEAATHTNYFAAQVGINTTSPAASALLDVASTTQGVRFPVMTTAQKNAISAPAEGLIVYDATLHKLCVRVAAAWETITSA